MSTNSTLSGPIADAVAEAPRRATKKIQPHSLGIDADLSAPAIAARFRRELLIPMASGNPVEDLAATWTCYRQAIARALTASVDFSHLDVGKGGIPEITLRREAQETYRPLINSAGDRVIATARAAGLDVIDVAERIAALKGWMEAYAWQHSMSTLEVHSTKTNRLQTLARIDRELEFLRVLLPVGPSAGAHDGPDSGRVVRKLTALQTDVWDKLCGREVLSKELASELNVHEACVRRAIKDLRAAGYKVDCRAGHGYSRPDAPPARA